MALTYGKYLQLDTLLNTQKQQSEGPEHDELLFIIIHQTYELWFKQILHETDRLAMVLSKGKTAQSLHTLKRILTITKTIVQQVDILETMTPLEFLTFRGRLETASGFQSFQFRELEFALGYKRSEIIKIFRDDTLTYKKLTKRFEEPTIWDAFLLYIQKMGYDIPKSSMQKETSADATESKELQNLLIRLYRDDAKCAQVCERLVDWDEGIQEWRYRHVKMVERTIGETMGSGGSSGVEYLQSTLFKPFFPDLWAIRNEFGM